MDDFVYSLIDNYIKAHPSIIIIFGLCTIITNLIRFLFPNEKKRSKYLNVFLYVLDVGAYNFWGLARFKNLKIKFPIMLRKTQVRKKRTRKKPPDIKNKRDT